MSNESCCDCHIVTVPQLVNRSGTSRALCADVPNTSTPIEDVEDVLDQERSTLRGRSFSRKRLTLKSRPRVRAHSRFHYISSNRQRQR